MKYIFTIFISFFCLQSCSQNKKNIIKENPLLLNIENFNYEPVYNLEVETIYNYEILINGIPILNKRNNFMSYHATIATPTILKSGLQNLEIRIYPIIPFVKEGAPAQPAKVFLQNDLKFKLIVKQTAWNKNGDLEEPKEVLYYKLPTLKDGREIDFSKLKEYKEKLTFTATVPYDLKGWENSIDFTSMDEASLKKEVAEFYNKLRTSFKDRNSDFYIDKIKNSEFNIYQSYYLTKIEALKKSNKWIEFVKEGKTLEPIDNYDMKIYGNGKLVSLRGTDPWNKDEGVLRYKYKKGGFNYILTFDIFLHKPKGAQEFKIAWFTMLDKNFMKGEAK